MQKYYKKTLIVRGIKRREDSILNKDINIKNRDFKEKCTNRQKKLAKALIIIKKCEKNLKKRQKMALKYWTN